MNFNFLALPWYAWIILILIVLVISFIIWINTFFTKEKQTKIVIQKVNKYFGFLYERGFKMQYADYFPEGNGAWTIILEAKECKIRINQDRGAISCEIAPIWASDEKYSDIYRVITQIEVVPQNINYSQTKKVVDSQLEFYAKLLNSYYSQVFTLINSYPKPPY